MALVHSFIPMKFLFFLFLSILLTIQLWSRAYPIVKDDSLGRIELDEVRIYGSKKNIQSNTFKTKSKLYSSNIELLCEENIAIKISANIKEFLLIKSVEIPFERKGERVNKIKQPQFYLSIGNSPSDSLFPLVPKEFKISQSKILITFDQEIKLGNDISEFFFLMKPYCSEIYFSIGYLLKFTRAYRSKNTYEYTKQNSFKIKDFREGRLEYDSGFPNWRIKITYATAK